MTASHGMSMDRDHLLQRLAETVAGDSALLRDDWEHLVLVCRIDDGGDTDDVTGFCYTSGGRAVPVSPRNFDIFTVLGLLRDAMSEADANRPWLAAMLRFDRAAGKVTAEFEYDRLERWTVTPQNVESRALEFARP